MEENMAQIEPSLDIGSCLAGTNWPIKGTGIHAQFGELPVIVLPLMLGCSCFQEPVVVSSIQPLHYLMIVLRLTGPFHLFPRLIHHHQTQHNIELEENFVKIGLKLGVCFCWDGINRNHILNHALWVLTAHYQCICYRPSSSWKIWYCKTLIFNILFDCKCWFIAPNHLKPFSPIFFEMFSSSFIRAHNSLLISFCIKLWASCRPVMVIWSPKNS